ncbi:MAG: primosomal protein N' [Thermoanaerobaculales bacterium]|nr:primosomal protein N' [Thermoanaerobaculales bacterium]
MFASVAIPRSAPESLLYRVPPELGAAVKPGIRVRVPLRRKQVTGVVIEVTETTELDRAVIRSMTEVLDTDPLLPAHIFDLADFISSYYRCPLGTTLAAMLPAGLLRSDAEHVEPTPLGAATDRQILPDLQATILGLLLEKGRMAVAGLLARSGAASRSALESLENAGLVHVRRTRRDRPPKSEVGAVSLASGDLEVHFEACSRAPRQREVIQWLADNGSPALESTLCGEIGCTQAIIRTLEKKGIVHRFRQAAERRPRWSLGGKDHRHDLTDEQRIAVDAVKNALDDGKYAPILLEGITGSGKTEVYLRCLEHALALGRQGLVLVPEIGLTPATVGAVERRFGTAVAVLHSAQSDGERWKEWLAIRSGRADIVVGPRSSLFAPIDRPGLIVVDEEHDGAYKQQDSPRYNARDLALVLGKNLGIPVLLCSATPSTEAAHLENRGLARRIRLTSRTGGASLPEVELVDLRQEKPEPGEHGRTIFSNRLRAAMTETLEAGHQVILLMQRRGWAPVLLCRDCGHTLECPSCSVAMVVHRRRGDLECHYCSHRRPYPKECTSCGGVLLDPIGAGTEKVAYHLKRYFPDISTAILDRDTVRRRSGLEDTLGAFASGRVKVLVGTQMVAKGHHFPNVTLTGVISADSLLSLPDFRAGERTFQLLTQLAGRAGRGSDPGRVVVQTYHPEHPAVLHAANHDVSAFIAEELRFRRAFGYPPVNRAALVRFESPSAEDARQAAERAWRRVNPAPEGVRVRGPAPSPIERLRDRWRWQILLTCPDRPPLRQALHQIEQDVMTSNVNRVIDVDPLSTL